MEIDRERERERERETEREREKRKRNIGVSAHRKSPGLNSLKVIVQTQGKSLEKNHRMLVPEGLYTQLIQFFLSGNEVGYCVLEIWPVQPSD
jgi:hypothetical protein